MEFRTKAQGRSGAIGDAFYRDVVNHNEITSKIEGQRAFCFYKDKLVIVHEKEGHWNLPGGGVEEGETLDASITREIAEESNMRVLKLKCLGSVDVNWPDRSRSYAFFACIVEPKGDFERDPANEVTEIKLIDPKDLPNTKIVSMR